MLQTAERLRVLTLKYLNEELSEEEQEELQQLLDSSPHWRETFATATHPQGLQEALKQYDAYEQEWQGMDTTRVFGTAAVVKSVGYNWKRIVPAAAAAVVLLSVTGWLMINKTKQGKAAQPVQVATVQDVKAGTEKATLRLSNNKIIELEPDKATAITDKYALIENKHGQLSYEVNPSDLPDNGVVTENVLTTPAGGYYRVRLSDGTLVWLNAVSSLTYPSRFVGKQRKVQLEGEAYFEVARDKDRPFFVEFDNKTIQVLGTKFNIEAYANEGIKRATLLEGAVAIGAGDKIAQKLKPGQQAVLRTGDAVVVKEVNAEAWISWTKGIFYFENASLVSLMHQLERWYGIKVTYSDEVTKKGLFFKGFVERSLSLSEMLDILGRMNKEVEFKQSASTVYVSLAMK